MKKSWDIVIQVGKRREFNELDCTITESPYDKSVYIICCKGHKDYHRCTIDAKALYQNIQNYKPLGTDPLCNVRAVLDTIPKDFLEELKIKALVVTINHRSI